MRCYPTPFHVEVGFRVELPVSIAPFPGEIALREDTETRDPISWIHVNRVWASVF